MRRKRHPFTAGLLLSLFVASLLMAPTLAETKKFTGDVRDLSVYSLSVESKHGEMKVFQIRPETKRPSDLHIGDTVKVKFVLENNIPVAVEISIRKRAQ